MIGIIGGVVSALGAITDLMVETPFYFISECLMIAMYLFPHSLRALL